MMGEEKGKKIMFMQQMSTAPFPALSPCCAYILGILLFAAPTLFLCISEVYSESVPLQLSGHSYGITFSACKKIDQGYLELSTSILHFPSRFSALFSMGGSFLSWFIHQAANIQLG